MTPAWRGVRLLAGLEGVLGPAPAATTCSLGGLEVDVMQPTAGYRGTVLTVHGMSPLGQRDPRMVALHGALARCGYRVVSPSFPSIAALRIHAGQIDRIERALHAVATAPTLCPSGRVGVFAVSFSAGLSLVAAGRPRVAGLVSGICAMGAFGDIEDTMRAVMTQPRMTSFAWKIVLANFLDASIGECPDVRQALLVAALDEWHKRTHPELPAWLATMSARDAELVRSLLSCADVRLRHFERIVATRPLLLDLASVVDQVSGLRAPLTLLHGEDDPTIPAGQSRAIHEACRSRGVRSRLVISPLLSHGGTTLRPRTLVAAPALLDGLGRWLAEVDTTARDAEHRAASFRAASARVG